MAMEQLPTGHVIAVHHTTAGCRERRGECSLEQMLGMVRQRRGDVFLAGKHLKDGRFMVSCVTHDPGNELQRLKMIDDRKGDP